MPTMYASRGHRSSTTPMDFEYTDRVGPVDANSPFMNIANQSAKKRKTPNNTPDFAFDSQHNTQKLTSGPPFGHTGPHAVLDSPSKNGFATPNRLRDPDNRPFFFSQESAKPLPSIPPHVQNAWEPRTPASSYDFSSGGETPNTPQIDSDAGTPDTQLADKMGRLGNGENGSPRKTSTRHSWFRRMMSSPSPTKESKEREKEDSRKYYSHKAENRIQKRRTERSERSRSKKKATLQDIDGDDSDNDQAKGGQVAPQVSGQIQQSYGTSIAGFFHWLDEHPNLPSTLSFWMQLMVNICLGAGFLYILYAVWGGIMSDVGIEADKHTAEVMVEITNCQRQYNANRCQPENMVPAMESMCGHWEACMKRNPRKVAMARVTARTFASIFNDFVEQFSYKAMVCITLIYTGWLCFIAHVAISWLHSRRPEIRHHSPSAQQSEQQALPPQHFHLTSQTPHSNTTHSLLHSVTPKKHYTGKVHALILSPGLHCYNNLRRFQSLKLGLWSHSLPTTTATTTPQQPLSKRLYSTNTTPHPLE